MLHMNFKMLVDLGKSWINLVIKEIYGRVLIKIIPCVLFLVQIPATLCRVTLDIQISLHYSHQCLELQLKSTPPSQIAKV
jgi:hypothetical protein